MRLVASRGVAGAELSTAMTKKICCLLVTVGQSSGDAIGKMQYINIVYSIIHMHVCVLLCHVIAFGQIL